jgi:23S rRNA (cytidine1920-2'-O)/16S rRNA (cytidine1409-2'-O)-methyltransferase
MGGKVFVGDRAVAKAGDMVAEDAELILKGKDHPWVSRGGIKLDHGLTHFGFDVTGLTAIDVGSSTGGFTDVLLTRGAAKVFAIDVGTNQLAWKLRQDERVVVMEQTNARDCTASTICAPVGIVVCDASFISLSKVLDSILDIPSSGAKLVALVKPQFEAGRGEVGKGGVVRDSEVHARVCDDAARWVTSKGWRVIGIETSPITGPEGNVEFLLGADKE